MEQTLYQVLKDNLKEKSEPETLETSLKVKESRDIEKERMIKKWKESAEYYNLNPEKFRFSLKNL